jgi:hypothetical protein
MTTFNRVMPRNFTNRPITASPFRSGFVDQLGPGVSSRGVIGEANNPPHTNRKDHGRHGLSFDIEIRDQTEFRGTNPHWKRLWTRTVLDGPWLRRGAAQSADLLP